MKSKKLLLGSLSAMALVATPIATVVSCGGKTGGSNSDKKAAPQATITKTDTKGFQVFLDSHESFYISEELAKTAGTLKAMIDGKVVDVYTWAKPIELGKDPEFKLHKGTASSKINVTIKQAVAKQFVVKPALWPKGAGMVISENTSKDWFDRRLRTRGTDGNLLGIKLPTAKNKTNVSKVTEAGIKEFNNFVKPLGWVAKMITATTTPEVPAKALSATKVTDVHSQIDLATSEQLLLMALTGYTDGSGNPINTSTITNAKGADAAAKLTAQKAAAKALITTSTKTKVIKTLTNFVVSWDTSKEDKADVAAVKKLLVANAITPAVATGAVAAITTATPITDLASLNTATPNIVFSATGALPTGATLNGVSIKIKSLSALAASGSAKGNLVIELSKGQATDTITIAVVGKA